MLVAEVRKAPNISESHRIPQAGKEEVALLVPVTSLHLSHSQVKCGCVILKKYSCQVKLTLLKNANFFRD